MTPSTKYIALVALFCSLTIATTNARAEEPEETTDSTDVESSSADVENRIDPHRHRLEFGSCYAYCDDLHARCLLSAYPPRPISYLRRDREYLVSDGYRRCERRFDLCVTVCRGPILYDR